MSAFLWAVVFGGVATHTAAAGDPSPRLKQAFVTEKMIYVWSLNDPPVEDPEGVDAHTTATKVPIGNTAGVSQTVRITTYSWEDYRFPFRYWAGAETLYSSVFQVEVPNLSSFVPGARLVSLPAAFVARPGQRPKPSYHDDGVSDEEGVLRISSGGGDKARPLDLRFGFVAAYRGDPDPGSLWYLTAKTQRPPFTFDLSARPDKKRPWRLYVQRTPRRVIDVVDLRPDAPALEQGEKVAAIPVPFCEPFYAHESADGTIAFVTEQTGRMYASSPPPAGKKEWTTREVLADRQRPVVAFVRDTRTGRAYAGTAAQDAKDRYHLIPLDGKAEPRAIDLDKLPRPDAFEEQRLAIRFAQAVAALKKLP